MKNIKKILPAVALAGAGIIGVIGAGSASAYNYSQLVGVHDGVTDADANPSNVAICYTITGITVPLTTTYTIQIEKPTGSPIDLSAVTATSANDTTYAYNASTGVGSFTIDFNNWTSSQPNCVHLNFGSALPAASNFGDYSVSMGVPTSSNPNAPIDDSGSKQISFGYQLATENDNTPKSENGIYQAEYWLKGASSYTSSVDRVNSHIEVTKTVKGNAATPVPTNQSGEDGFIFKARLTKKYASIPDTAYNIYVNGHQIRTCSFASSLSDTSKDCEFRLNHGETAYIGCSSSACANNGTLPLDGIEYIITETDAKGHTTYVDGSSTASTNTGSQELNATPKTHTFVNEKTNTIAGRFFNIIPFIILAILATVGVVTLRKANKKNEA